MRAKNFYTSARWLAKRERILKRDGYMCVECRRYGRHDADGNPVRAELVHHIKEYEKYPELGLVDSNLESLCGKCHNKRHPERNAGRYPPHSRWTEKRRTRNG